MNRTPDPELLRLLAEDRSWLPPMKPTGQTYRERLRQIGPSVGLAVAGMVPGVGEAVDAHDLVQAVRDRSPVSAGLSGLGLALPFVAMGGVKRLGKGAEKAVEATATAEEAAEQVKRPLILWSKAPQEVRDDYLNSLEGVREPIKQATDVVSRNYDPELRSALQPSLKNIATFSALAALMRAKQEPARSYFAHDR